MKDEMDGLRVVPDPVNDGRAGCGTAGCAIVIIDVVALSAVLLIPWWIGVVVIIRAIWR